MPRNWYSCFHASVLLTGAIALGGCNSLDRGRTVAVQTPSGGRQSAYARVSKPAASKDDPAAAEIPAEPAPAGEAESMAEANPAPEAAVKPAYSPAAPPMPPVTMSQWVESQRGKVTRDAQLDTLEVDLANTDIADDGVAQLLSEAARITKLDLTGTDVTDAALANLLKLSNLRVLKLNETEVTDRGIAQLAALQSLEFVGLASTGVTDESLKALAGLPQVRYLLLDSNSITDAGLVELQRATMLEGVSLVETNVTSEGVKKLEAALPKCVVLWREKSAAVEPGDSAAPMPPQAIEEGQERGPAPMPPMDNEGNADYQPEPRPAPGTTTSEAAAPAPPPERTQTSATGQLPRFEWGDPAAKKTPGHRSIPFPATDPVSTEKLDPSPVALPVIVPNAAATPVQTKSVPARDPNTNVAWSVDQTRFAMVQKLDQTIVVFQAAHAAEGREMEGKVSTCRDLRFVNNDHLLVAVTENTTGLRPAWEAITWNAGTGSRIETLFLGEDVASVTFVPNTSLIVVTRSNRERQLVDVAAPHDRAAMKVPVTEDLIRRISAAARE